jgi:hypothetical protein
MLDVINGWPLDVSQLILDDQLDVTEIFASIRKWIISRLAKRPIASDRALPFFHGPSPTTCLALTYDNLAPR